MADEIVYKKMYRKADEHLKDTIPVAHGKKANQKMKPYIVLQYLMKHTDENHVASAYDIIAYLESLGITAERRSIYTDIDEINKIIWMMENQMDLEEVKDLLDENEENLEKTIVYDKNKKGFYVQQRHYDLNDVRLLAECVYSAKFIEEKRAKRLVRVVCDLVSEEQAKQITHDAFLSDRVKTENTAVYYSVSTINEAMSRELNGERHKPEKIDFLYQKHSISDVRQTVNRRNGARYIVSPYKLIINDGNYYLLGFDDEAQEMRTYRVDRMKDVRLMGEPRDGEKEFSAIDLKTYTQRTFSMFGGQDTVVTLRFENYLLDAVVERFGSDQIRAQYVRVDNDHFSVTTHVEISDQFFGWVLGFGDKVKMTGSDTAVGLFKAYLDKVREMYES